MVYIEWGLITDLVEVLGRQESVVYSVYLIYFRKVGACGV